MKMNVGQLKGLAAALTIAVAAGVLGSGEANAQTRTERFFDDWKVLCVENAEAAKQCSMSQTLAQSNPRREVLRWTIVPDRENQMVNVISAPLGVALKPGLEIALTESEPLTVAYEVCGRRWCQARLDMSDEVWSQMATGQAVEVVYMDQRGRRLRMEATTRGFREAIEYLQGQIAS